MLKIQAQYNNNNNKKKSPKEKKNKSKIIAVLSWDQPFYYDNVTKTMKEEKNTKSRAD